MQRERFAALFQQVDIAGLRLAMEFQLKSIDQERLKHLAQMFILNPEPGIPESFDAG
jgi:hypothetical protein